MSQHFLTEDDRRVLIRVRRMLDRMDQNQHHYTELMLPNPAQDVYIAKLPAGPGIVLAGMDPTSLTPGTANCEIYQLDQDAGTISLIEFPDASAFAVPVYNLHSNPYFGFTKYIRVAREKGGAWVCDKPPINYRAQLNADLVQGSSSTANIFYRDIDTDTWVDSGEVVDVWEFSLNLDEMYVATQKGWVDWDEGGVWVFDSTACPVADDTGLGG